jgi:prepilin-type N-terminal cleavage/methylation domain-containing protein
MALAISLGCCTYKLRGHMSAFQQLQSTPGLDIASPDGRQTRASQRGLTLIEMIGVLAIIAVVASIVLPALVRQTDKAVADLESASLQSFGTAFQNNVMRTRRIPGLVGNDWATNVAGELGLNIADVTNNVRRQPRLFLIDTNGFAGLLNGPTYAAYVQTNAGTLAPTNSSFNPRIMIVSSLGKAVPSAVSSAATTPLLTADFNKLWTWDGTAANFPTTGAWNGWTGSPYDITVQRINLSPLLVNLYLNYNNPPRNNLMCSYAIDYTNNPIASVTNSTSNITHGYFLKNSVLALFYTNASSVLVTDSFQVLNRDSTFIFDQNRWFNSLGNPTNTGIIVVTSSGGSGISTFDFTDMVNGFLNAPGPTATGPGTNQLLPSVQQSNVVTAFINYMTSYTNWAPTAPANNALYTTALNSQTSLVNNVNGLINSITPH